MGRGDFNGDGKVDVNDLTILLSSFGETLGASSLSVAGVPEPSSLILVGVGAVGLFGFVCRRRKHGA